MRATLLRCFISYFILLFFLSCSADLSAQGNKEKLIKALSNLESDPVLKDGRLGFSLAYVDDKSTIVGLNESKGLVPASNLKLITTATALAILGPEYRYETHLEYDGKIVSGVLDGNLYIRGSGDPTFGSDRFKETDWNLISDKWLLSLKELGIKRITGSVIGDGSVFDNNPIPEGWIWSDIGNYYGAGVFGLNIYENTYKLIFRPGKVSEKAEILRTEPDLPFNYKNEVITAAAGTGDNAYIYGSPYTDFRMVSGTIPAGSREFTIKGSLPDPVGYCAGSFLRKLQENGIEINQKASNILFIDKPLVERTKIAVHLSPELKQVVYYTNMYSINLYAESLLKTLGSYKKKNGSVKGGLQVVSEYWSDKNISECFKIYDGSGLSGTNLVSPNFMVQAMQKISLESFSESLYESLPVAGKSGTLWNVCKGTPAENKLRAKSGTLKGVICYSGYVRDKNGKIMAFSIMVNNYSCNYSAMRKKIEEIMAILPTL
ncbi:MAG: D-alanyl-D-alanine carboxypeptidase/D-alanyl-D-alanine-endopeptidase [Cytophagaceae bacterium]